MASKNVNVTDGSPDVKHLLERASKIFQAAAVLAASQGKKLGEWRRYSGDYLDIASQKGACRIHLRGELVFYVHSRHQTSTLSAFREGYWTTYLLAIAPVGGRERIYLAEYNELIGTYDPIDDTDIFLGEFIDEAA